MHSRKPEKAIFDAALREMKVCAEEALFIDDMVENVEAARQFGWNAIRVEPETVLAQEMTRYDLM